MLKQIALDVNDCPWLTGILRYEISRNQVFIQADFTYLQYTVLGTYRQSSLKKRARIFRYFLKKRLYTEKPVILYQKFIYIPENTEKQVFFRNTLAFTRNFLEERSCSERHFYHGLGRNKIHNLLNLKLREDFSKRMSAKKFLYIRWFHWSF